MLNNIDFVISEVLNLKESEVAVDIINYLPKEYVDEAITIFHDYEYEYEYSFDDIIYGIALESLRTYLEEVLTEASIITEDDHIDASCGVDEIYIFNYSNLDLQIEIDKIYELPEIQELQKIIPKKLVFIAK